MKLGATTVVTEGITSHRPTTKVEKRSAQSTHQISNFEEPKNTALKIPQRSEHSCKICGKLYMKSGCLKQHEKIHEAAHKKIGETLIPFKCSKCGRYFSNSKRLSMHMREHVPETDDNGPGGKVDRQVSQKCTEYASKFSNHELLSAHMKTPEAADAINQISQNLNPKLSLKSSLLKSQRDATEESFSNAINVTSLQSGLISKIPSDHEDQAQDKRFTVDSNNEQKCTVIVSETYEELVPSSPRLSNHAGKRKVKVLKTMKPLKCSRCRRYFSSPTTLATHIRTHCAQSAADEPESIEKSADIVHGPSRNLRSSSNSNKVGSEKNGETKSSRLGGKDKQLAAVISSAFHLESFESSKIQKRKTRKPNSQMHKTRSVSSNTMRQLALEQASTSCAISGVGTGKASEINAKDSSPEQQMDVLTIEINNESENNAKEQSRKKLQVMKNVRRRSRRVKSSKTIEVDDSDSTSYDESWRPMSPCKKRMSRLHNRAESHSYICNVCLKKLLTSRSMRHHMLDHAKDHPHSCGKCVNRFATEAVLREHEATHSEKTRFICNHCGKSLSTAYILKKHITLHTGGRRHVCPTCGLKYLTAYALRYHMEVHDNAKPHKCEICQKSFRSKYSLRYHATRHAGTHTCSHCGKVLGSAASLRNHTTLHTGKRLYVCATCGMKCPTPYLLKRHAKVHATMKPHTCTVCQKSFRTKCFLKVHASRHAGTYVCSYCGKALGSADALKNHVTLHTGDRRYVCPTCGKKYPTSSKLKYHIKVHDTARPYCCKNCQKGFRTEYLLQQHVGRNFCNNPHDSKQLSSNQSDTYRCPECLKSFSKSELSNHMKNHLIVM